MASSLRSGDGGRVGASAKTSYEDSEGETKNELKVKIICIYY